MNRGRQAGTAVAAAGAAGVALAWAALARPYGLQLGTLVVIQGLMAAGLNVLMGYTGLTSFGQAAFFGTAAYTTALATTRWGWAVWPAATLGFGAGIILGVVFGWLTVRARSVYFLLMTLALGQVAWGVAYRWVSVTGGDNGLPGIPRPPGALLWPLQSDAGFFLLTAGVGIVALVLLARFSGSPVGLALRGIRESSSRMRTLGYRVEAYRMVGFGVAAAYAALAGVLWALYNGFVSPLDLHMSTSAQAVLGVVIGGAGSFWGPLVGAGLVVLLQNLLSTVTQRWMLVLGLLYIAVVRFAPRGLAGWVASVRRRRAWRMEGGRRALWMQS